jgi:hypothetical protein
MMSVIDQLISKLNVSVTLPEDIRISCLTFDLDREAIKRFEDELVNIKCEVTTVPADIEVRVSVSVCVCVCACQCVCVFVCVCV